MQTIVKFLAEHWKLSEDTANSLAKLLLAQEIEEDTDIILLSAELNNRTSKESLSAFSDTLFQVAASEDGLCEEEINEIICISAYLGMNHVDFERNLKKYAGSIS